MYATLKPSFGETIAVLLWNLILRGELFLAHSSLPAVPSPDAKRNGEPPPAGFLGTAPPYLATLARLN